MSIHKSLVLGEQIYSFDRSPEKGGKTELVDLHPSPFSKYSSLLDILLHCGHKTEQTQMEFLSMNLFASS